jgi:hypothetical protein
MRLVFLLRPFFLFFFLFFVLFVLFVFVFCFCFCFFRPFFFFFFGFFIFLLLLLLLYFFFLLFFFFFFFFIFLRVCSQGLERSWFFFSGYGAYSMPVNLTNNATHGLGVQYAKPAGLGLGMPDSVVTTDVWYLGLATFSMLYSLYFALHAILGHFGHEHDPPIGSNQYSAGRAVFDAWDFALSDKHAAEDNLAKIGGALKVLVDVRAELAVTGTKTWKACFIFYFRKAVGLTLSLCLVLGAAFIIGYSLVRAQTVQKMAIDAAPQIAPFSGEESHLSRRRRRPPLFVCLLRDL